MSVFDKLFSNLFSRKQQNDSVIPPKALVPGRLTYASGSGMIPLYSGRPQHARYDPYTVMRNIIDYNPDASLATWNFLRLVNPECSFKVTRVDTQEVDEEAKKMLDSRTDNQFGVYGRDYGGGLSVLVDVFILSILMNGSVCSEIEIAENLKDVLDWCPVNPSLIAFNVDEKTGHFSPYTWVGGKSIDFSKHSNQFRYVPLDPVVSDPSGRSPFLPAFESVFFQTEVLRDLKQVAHVQGHPRLHFSVLDSIAESNVPQHLNMPGQEDAKRQWMNAWLTQIADAYKTLQPDDALFTWDWVEAKGVSAGDGSFDTKALVDIVESQVIASLKHLPILLGRIDGSGLAHGTVQWQIFSQTIVSLRRPIITIMSWLATQTLRVWGYPSIAILEFPKLRTQDRLREAQAESLEVQTALLMEMQGWVSQDENAMRFTGHKPVSAPFVAQGGKDDNQDDENDEDQDDEGVAGSEDEPEAMSVVGPGLPESEYFRSLPIWMRKRIESLQLSVTAMSDVWRSRKFKEVDGE